MFFHIRLMVKSFDISKEKCRLHLSTAFVFESTDSNYLVTELGTAAFLLTENLR